MVKWPLMAERKALFDTIFVGRMHQGGTAQTAPALGILGLAQMPPAGARAQHFAAGADLEALRGGFFGLNAFWTSHNENSFLSKKSAQYRAPHRGKQAVILALQQRVAQRAKVRHG
jgi:hypothetical protein